MAFSARYPGECGNCDQHFGVGATVEYKNDQLVHFPACPPEPAPKRYPRCPVCTLEHPGQC